MLNPETDNYIAQAYDPENRAWTTFCNMWWRVTDKFGREKLAAPLPPKSGYYWIRRLHDKEWLIADYYDDDEWMLTGSDYYNSTVEEGIVEWRGPLEPPND